MQLLFHHVKGCETRHNLHWGCGASSSSTCKVYNHNGEGEFFLNICTCYNIARFLGDVSGLAEFVDDKVTVFHCYFETEMARSQHILDDHGDIIENDVDVHEHNDQNEVVNDDDAGDLLPARLLLGFDAAPQQVEAGGSSSSGPSLRSTTTITIQCWH